MYPFEPWSLRVFEANTLTFTSTFKSLIKLITLTEIKILVEIIFNYLFLFLNPRFIICTGRIS